MKSSKTWIAPYIVEAVQGQVELSKEFTLELPATDENWPDAHILFQLGNVAIATVPYKVAVATKVIVSANNDSFKAGEKARITCYLNRQDGFFQRIDKLSIEYTFRP